MTNYMKKLLALAATVGAMTAVATDVISINFGSNQTDASMADQADTVMDGSLAGDDIPANSWNDFSSPSATDTAVATRWDGSAKQTLDGVTVSYSGRGGNYHPHEAGRSTISRFMNGYIDDNANSQVSVTVKNIPYETYDVILYYQGDNVAHKFRPVEVNGVKYAYDDSTLRTVTTETLDAPLWGKPDQPTAAYGVNAIHIAAIKGVNLEILPGHYAGSLGGYQCRGTLAAVQIIKSRVGETVTWANDNTSNAPDRAAANAFKFRIPESDDLPAGSIVAINEIRIAERNDGNNSPSYLRFTVNGATIDSNGKTTEADWVVNSGAASPQTRTADIFTFEGDALQLAVGETYDFQPLNASKAVQQGGATGIQTGIDGAVLWWNAAVSTSNNWVPVHAVKATIVSIQEGKKLLTATLEGTKTWNDIEWTCDGAATAWVSDAIAEITVTGESALTLDPTIDVTAIKIVGSSALTLTTADGAKPVDEFLAKMKLSEYTGKIIYGWNAFPTVLAINFNATANDNGDAGGSDDHKLADDENANILGMNIFGSKWNQVTTRTQSEAQTVTAYNTETGESAGTAQVTWRSDNVYMYRDSEDKVIRGYLDDGGDHASVTISEIPFATYDVIIICATDQGNRKFNPVSVNGTSYRWDAESGTTIVASSGTWGQCHGAHVEYGENAIKISQLTETSLSIIGGGNANNARGGIAAVLLVQSEAGPVEIMGDLTMAELAEKMAGQDDVIVTVLNSATLTQDGTTLPCTHLAFRAEEPKTLSFALTADQLAAVAALEPNTEYDVLTAIFGLKPSLENVTIAVTNVPTDRKFLLVGGQPTIVRPSVEAIFTLPNDTDWMGHTVPFYSKTLAATGNTSFAGNTAYLQSLTSGDATVAVVTAAPTGSRIFGLFALTGEGDDHGLGPITRDIYLKVTGGTPGVISGGEDAVWSGDKTNPTGNILLNLTGDTLVDYVYGAGLGGGTGGMLATIDGNIGIVVDGNAQIKGTLAAGWQSRHNTTPKVTGNTSVLIKNVQTHEGDATLSGNPNCAQGWILGGGIFKTNNGRCLIEGNSSVTIDLANSATGEFMKKIAGGGHNEGGGDGENTAGDSSVTINAPDTVTFSKTILGGGHSTGTNKAKTGGDSSVTLNGGTYTGTIIAAGDNGEHTQVDGSATLTITSGNFTAATLQAGTATGAKTLNISGGTFVFKNAFSTGFDVINFSGDFAYSFPDGLGVFTPINLGASALTVDGQSSGQVTRTADIHVGEIVINNATVVFDCDACTVYYMVAQEGTLRRRPDFDGMTDADRHWTAPGSWLDSNNKPVDWPMTGAKIVEINADQVSSIIVDARITADMINLTNTAAQEAEPSFKFLTLEPLDEVADMTKTNPEYVILGKLTASSFRGDLYLQSRITMAVALGVDTHVFFVAWEEGKETTAYPYEFSNMVNPICKVGPGAFVVPSSMYTYAFNVNGGSLIYDIAAETEATVSGVLQKDTPAEPEMHLLIKRGTGTMTYATRLRTGFLDGLEIRQGTLKLQSSGDFDFVGTTEPLPVTVKSGATLDMNGQTGFAAAVTLEGGATLANSNGEIGTGSASLRSITLTGNATVDATARFGLLAIGYGATTLDLGGHTLTKTGSEAFHLCRTSGTGAGTINVQAGTLHSVHQEVSLPNVEVVLGADATFDVSAATTIGGLTLGPTYTFAGNSTLTIAKKLTYAGETDAVFSWYEATLGEGATIAYPTTPFTMKFPVAPASSVALPSVAKVELSVPNLSVGYEYPITGVAKENVIVKVNGETSSAARVEVTGNSILIRPPLSRYNPVTGEDFGFVNAFRGTTDADWATIGNWYTGNESAWTPYAGSIAPMMTNSNAWDPALIDGNLITDSARRDVTLAAMEGWYIRLGLFNGVTVTVDSLVKIQSDNPASIMVDATSKLKLAAPSNSKNSVIDLYIAGPEGLTWTSTFSSINTINYHFAGEGSVSYTAGASAGTHTIKRFDLEIGDDTQPGMQKGIVSKKLIALGAASTATFTIASDAKVIVTDAARHPEVVPTKSAVDALTGNEALGTYYLLKTDDGVYVKYIGYSTDPERPIQSIIDHATRLSEFTFPSAGEVIVLGAATWKDAFDITFDRAVPEGITFAINGYVNIKSTDDAGVLAAIPYLTIPESGAGARLFFTALPDDLSVVPNKFIYRVSNDLSSGYQLSKGAATYEFVNARLTNQNGANYKLYVADGDVLSLAGQNSPPRTSPSLIVEGGSVTLGASSNNAFWYGGVDGQTTYVQTAGRVEVPVVGTATSGSGSGLLLGFSGSGLAMSISGGELLVPNSALNFWVCPQVNLSGTGYVKAKGVFKGSNNGAVTISENAIFDLGSLGWQGIALNLNGGKLNAFENATVSVPMTIAAGAKLGAASDATLTIAQPITAAGKVVITGPGKVALAEGAASETDVFEVESGVLDVGLTRPIVNVLDGAKVRLTATEADVEKSQLVLKVTEDAATGGTDKVEIVDGNGSPIRIRSVSVDPVAHTVTIILATASINTSMTMSEIKEAYPDGGTLAIVGSAECDDSITITLDTAIPAAYTFTVAGHITVAATGVSQIPLSKFALNENACLVLNAPIAEETVTIAANRTIKTRADQTITLTNNGTFVVKSGATATVTASAAQAIKGTVTIEKGATFVNTLNDAIPYGTPGATVNVYGTLDMGTTRWTVGGQSQINLYGSARITGVGDGEGVLDIYRDGNTISVFNVDGEGSAAAIINGLIRTRNADGNIWIQEGATLALPGGIQGAQVSAPKVTRKGAGHLAGLIPLRGTMTLDYGSQQKEIPAHFAVLSGTVTFHVTGKNGSTDEICIDDSKDDPFMTVVDGATLNLKANNLSGSSGALTTHGWIKVGGTLVLQDGEGYRYFRNHLALLDEATVKINSGTQPVVLYGGAGDENNAQISLDPNMSAKIIVGEAGSGNGKIVLAHSEDATPGVGIAVAHDSTLTIEAPIEGADPLYKWGTGTLNIDLSRPLVATVEGRLVVKVTDEEAKNLEAHLPVTEETYSRVNFGAVNAAGSDIEVTDVEVRIDEETGAKTLAIYLRGNIYDYNVSSSSLNDAMQGSLILKGGSDEDTAITFTFDSKLPAGVTDVVVMGHVHIKTVGEPENASAPLYLAEESLATMSGAIYPFPSSRGPGSLAFDPGEGHTILVAADNHDVTGTASILSGTVKMGHQQCLGKWDYDRNVTVMGGATLDTNAMRGIDGTTYCVRLREGAIYTNTAAEAGDIKFAFPVSKLILEGDAIIRADTHRAGLSRHYNNQTVIEFGAYTLTKVGQGEAYFSNPTMNGTGRFVIAEGMVRMAGGSPAFANGTIVIDPDAVLSMDHYTGGTKLSVKYLVNNGTYTAADQSHLEDSHLTVTGELSGTGRFVTPVRLGANAVLKLSAEGCPRFDNYAPVSQRSDTKINLSVAGLDLTANTRLRILDVDEEAHLPAADAFVGTPARWIIRRTATGFGYKLMKPYLAVSLDWTNSSALTVEDASYSFETGELTPEWSVEAEHAFEATTPTAPACGYPIASASHNRVLDCVDSTYQSPLVCTSPKDIAEEGVYLDTMIKLTPGIDENVPLNGNEHIKIWCYQPTTGGAVKLRATAGEYTDWTSTVRPRVYDLTPGTLAADSWHRLTIKALPIATTSMDEFFGFVVYLDGELLTYAGKPATSAADGCCLESLTTSAEQYYSPTAARNALLPSLIDPNEKTLGYRVRSASIAGMGLVDDFVFSTTPPEFAKNDFAWTLTWDSHVTSLTVDGEPIDLTAGTSKVFDLEGVSKQVTLEATFADGYLPSRSWTNGLQWVGSGDVINAVAFEKTFDVAGTVFSAEVDKNDYFPAVKAAMTGRKTLKLLTDYGARQIYIEHEPAAPAEECVLVLDLNGKTLGGVEKSPTIYVNAGCSLKIIDSVGGGKIVAVADQPAIWSQGAVTIEAGTIEGELVGEGEAALFTFVARGAKIAKGEEAVFPYALKDGLDAFESDDYWTIDTATQVTIHLPPAEHATPTVTVDGSGVTIVENVAKIDFGATAVVTWTAAEGYRITDGTETETITPAEGVTQILALEPSTDFIVYTVTYVYKTPDGTVITPAEGELVNLNVKNYNVTIVEPITIDIDKITIAGGTVLAVNPDTIDPAAATDVTVTVTVEKEATMDWPEDPESVRGKTAAEICPSLEGTELENVDAADVSTWAKAQTIDYATAGAIIKPDAFLLNCANTDAAIAAKAATFKFSAADLATLMAGGTLTTLNGLDHNGKLVVYGSTDLRTWHTPNTEGDTFWKAELDFKTVEVK